MLFNILFVFLVLYVMAMPILVIKYIKFGLMIADEPEKAAEKPVFNVPKFHRKPKLTAEQKKAIDIMQNLDIFDGTSLGQKEIKNG